MSPVTGTVPPVPVRFLGTVPPVPYVVFVVENIKADALSTSVAASVSDPHTGTSYADPDPASFSIANPDLDPG